MQALELPSTAMYMLIIAGIICRCASVDITALHERTITGSYWVLCLLSSYIRSIYSVVVSVSQVKQLKVPSSQLPTNKSDPALSRSVEVNGVDAEPQQEVRKTSGHRFVCGLFYLWGERESVCIYAKTWLDMLAELEDVMISGFYFLLRPCNNPTAAHI